MSDYIKVGNVISIDGIKVSILMNEHTNLEQYHYNGDIYLGVTVGSYIGIIRGNNKIIARVDKEFSEDQLNAPKEQKYLYQRFRRILEVTIIGNFYNGKFTYDRQKFPLIFNEVVLLNQQELESILVQNSGNTSEALYIGNTLSTQTAVHLRWSNLFNTHIGIFGNTGSGKSNTLAAIYGGLFELEQKHKISISGKSQFFFLDFNGEYTGKQIFSKNKTVLKLSTRKNSNTDKINFSEQEFWNIETLSILYSATEKTQRPFMQNAVKFLMEQSSGDIDFAAIKEGLSVSFYHIFFKNNNKESLALLNRVLDILELEASKLHDWLNCLWHSKSSSYYNGSIYINSFSREIILDEREKFTRALISAGLKDLVDKLTVTDKLKIALYMHLIYLLSYNQVQYEHIAPLLQRVESYSVWINKIFNIKQTMDWKDINVISLRNCNLDAKKMIPLLLAKQLYSHHKEHSSEREEIDSTVHLIVDEAHNILSESSVREASSWKDYRLEVFEEIIKEGRKFGFYITLASQRPSDISQTIISQLHHYFIHRLVNEQDLKMVANTVNSLDSLSKAQIPTLTAGQCVISGVSLDLPLLVQIKKLEKAQAPNSESADLVKLWGKSQ